MLHGRQAWSYGYWSCAIGYQLWYLAPQPCSVSIPIARASTSRVARVWLCSRCMRVAVRPVVNQQVEKIDFKALSIKLLSQYCVQQERLRLYEEGLHARSAPHCALVAGGEYDQRLRTAAAQKSELDAVLHNSKAIGRPDSFLSLLRIRPANPPAAHASSQTRGRTALLCMRCRTWWLGAHL